MLTTRTFLFLAIGFLCFWYVEMPCVPQVASTPKLQAQKFTPRKGVTELMQAVMDHDLARVRALIASGANVDASTSNNYRTYALRERFDLD